MKTIWEQSYIVTDVETTGHSPFEHRISEIACVVVEGGEIVREYSTLINPHQTIPPYIANMTGISNKMASNAPEESSICSIIDELLSRSNAVFSAHNIEFDWSFAKQLLQRGGLQPPALPMLCTLKLARRMLPSDLKKNVGSLSQYFNIPVSNRHRALGDARATAQILIELMEMAEEDFGIKYFHELENFQNSKSQVFKIKSENVSKLKEISLALPTSSGIYKFFDKDENIIFIGKSKNLRAKVSTYFCPKGTKSKRHQNISKLTQHIETHETQSELEAILLEAELIKEHKPHFNKSVNKKNRYPYIKITNSDDFPKSTISYEQKEDGAKYFGPFSNSSFAQEIQKIINNNFRLIKCDFDNQAKTPKKSCIYRELDKCALPCDGPEQKEIYKDEVTKVERFLGEVSKQMVGGLDSTIYNFNALSKKLDNVLSLGKIFSKSIQAPLLIENNNLIVISPESKREQTLDIYFIKRGDFVSHFRIGKFSDIARIKSEVDVVFNNNNNIFSNGGSASKIERLQIVSSWMNKEKEKCKLVYHDEKKKGAYLEEVRNAIRNFRFA